nr:MAG TPA: hypothetical protein [Caudoviricetes sp.]DAK54184.1 MAG TPA: hypothetical protein [Caudoviricetes sp.]DAW08268.1 MAG TPA: hypothetical protein [Caudoviricetes sp.]
MTPRYCASSCTFATDGVCPFFTLGSKSLPAPLSLQAIVGATPFSSQYFLTF